MTPDGHAPTPDDVIEFQDADAVQDQALVDRYFLRDILWCGPCDLPLRPALVNGRLRYYSCGNLRCRRPAVPAETMEQQMWGRFVRLNELFAHGVPRDRRNAALREVLCRVVVGRATADLTLQWRD